jgi:hypothetical protein
MEPTPKLGRTSRKEVGSRLRAYWQILLQYFAPRAQEDVPRAEERLRSMNEPPPPLPGATHSRSN